MVVFSSPDAETILKIMTLKTSKQLNDLETAHLLQTLYEHQIELELQNEELQIAKRKADEAREKYIELYDFAPSGYFTLSKQSDILELNIRGSQMIGKERVYLINKKFNLFVSDDTKQILNTFLERIFQCKTRQTCEVTLLGEGAHPMFVQLTGLFTENEDRCLLTAVDITAHRNTEDALKLNQDFLNNIVENSPNSLWISDDKGVLIRMNQACRDIFQISDEDVVGKYNIFKDNLIETQGFMPLVKKVFENGKTVKFVTSYDASKIDGLSPLPSRNLILEVHISTIFNTEGRLTNAIVQHFDITGRDFAERLVIASKARLDKTQEMAHLGSWELDLQSGQVTWSDEVYRIFGLLPQEFNATYEAFLERVHPEDRNSVNSAYMDSIHNQLTGYEIQHRMIHKNTGEIKYVFEKCEHIRDASGRITRSVGMVQDITERKLSENALLESESKFRRYMENAPDSIFIIDDNGQYIEVNEMVTTSLGYSREEILNLFLHDVIAEESLPDGLAHYKKLKESGNAVADLQLKHKNGSKIWMTLNAVTLSPQRFLCFGKDITEKKRIEEALILSEEKFRSFIQFSSEPIFGFNRDETYHFVNEAFSHPFGKNPDEIIGKTPFDIFPDGEAEKRLALVRKVFQTGEKGEIEVKVNTHSGESQYYLTTADPSKNEKGEVLYVNCVSKDITQLKKTEQALLESEEIFQSFMKYSPVYIFFKDENLKTIKLSKNYEKMLGKPLSELIGKNLNLVVPSSLALNLEADDQEAMTNGKVVTSEEELNGRSYTTIKFPVIIEGKPQYLAGFTIDITDRKNAEEALKISEAQVNALLTAIPDMIFIQDQQGIYQNYHGPIDNQLYTQPNNFIGKSMYDVIPLEIAQQFDVAFQAALQTGEVQLCEYTLKLPEGINYFEAKIVAYANSQFLSVIRNVSSHKQAQELIRVKNEDLQRINGEKDKFFSIIAHDLRSPFSGFLGLTETLARRLPDMTLKEIQEVTFLMRNSAVHLFRLLGNLLEWSRMQRGLMAFAPKSFLIRQKIADYLILANQLANQKEILINEQIPEDLTVFADENMFGSIIRNLLSNAVKFTPKGGRITISAEKLSSRLVEFSVKDSGIGMTQVLIDHLFLLHDVQSNRKGTEGEYSSGLGLIICKDFVEKHGGKLKIKSNENMGSIFSFTMPADSLSFNISNQ